MIERVIFALLAVAELPFRLVCRIKGHQYRGHMMCERCWHLNVELLDATYSDVFSAFRANIKKQMNNPNSDLRLFIASKQTPEQRALFNRAAVTMASQNATEPPTAGDS